MQLVGVTFWTLHASKAAAAAAAVAAAAAAECSAEIDEIESVHLALLRAL